MDPTIREGAIQQFKDELLIVSGIKNDPPNSLSSLDTQEDAVPNDKISALDAFFDFDVSLYSGNFKQMQISTDSVHFMRHSIAVMYCYQRDPWGGKQECEGQRRG